MDATRVIVYAEPVSAHTYTVALLSILCLIYSL